jgi:flagellar assembly factor FliW
LDSSLVLSLNYNKSINRPHFLNATSITTFITPYYEYTRNVNLQSTITQEISANLALKNNSLGIAYVTRNAPVFVASTYQANLSRILSQPINFDKEQSLNVTLLIPIRTKIWSATNYTRWSIVELKDIIGEKVAVKPYWYFYSRNQFRINKTTNTGFTGFLFTNQAQGIIQRKGLGTLSLFFNTTILKKFNLGISWNDVFQSQEYTSESTFNGVFIDETRFTDRREFSIALRYNIGKRFKSNYKNKDVDLNLERM